jgi:hypothetical protein
MLGAAFFIVTVFVPALLVAHVLIFRLLVRRQTAAKGLEHIELSGGPRGEPHRSVESVVAIGS